MLMYVVAVVWVYSSSGVGQNDAGPEKASVAEQLQAIRRGVDAVDSAYLAIALSEEPERRAQAQKLWQAYTRTNDSAIPLLAPLIRQNPATPEAFEGAEWIVTNRRIGVRTLMPYAVEMLQLLGKYHAKNPKLGRVCSQLGKKWRWDDQLAREFLQAVIDNNPDPRTRGQAALALARFAKAKAEEGDVDSREAASSEAQRLYEAVMRDYGEYVYADPRPSDKTYRLSELAERELFELVSLAVGRQAPEIDGEDLDGQKFKLSDYRSKVVVLSFWATWCGPCMQMIPHERRLVERMKGKPFALIGVNGDEDVKKAKAAVNREKIGWRSFWDRGSNGRISTAWKVQGWPMIYVMDAKGLIRFKEVYGKDLDEAVDRLVGETP